MLLSGFEDTDSVHGKCMADGASVVTADSEHYERKNTACNESCVAREVVQTPHCSGSDAGACLY